jgi:uncharacterized protein (TIGR03086 family)
MTSASQYFAVSADRFSQLLADVTPSSWASPSMCEGWSVADVLGHVVSTQLDFLANRGLAETLALDLSSTEGAAPIDAWPTVRAALQTALDTPAVATSQFDGYFGPTTIEATIHQFYANDLVMHRWDIAAALGLAHHAVLQPDEILEVGQGMKGLGAAMRMPGVFGPELSVDPSADAQTRLLAVLGRATSS